MPSDVEFENRQIWMEGSYSSKPVNLKNARIVEQLSLLTQTTIEFLSTDKALDLQDILGSDISIGIKDADEKERFFTGTCVSVEYVGVYQGQSHFVAETRPWLWFLTRTQESRIYQEKSAVEIIEEILGDYGFSSDLQKKTSGSYAKRPYCVQYHETEFAFISRLMEEEGMYYFFVQDGKKLKMVLADGISAHKPCPEAELDFKFKELTYRREYDHVFDWAEATGVTTGKVTLSDYDFIKPKAEKKTVSTIEKGDHKYKKYEHYRYPGHSRLEDAKDDLTKVRMEALAVKHQIARGAGNVRVLGVGQTFKLKDHPRKVNNREYLVTRAVHHLQIETDYEDVETKNPLFDSTIPVHEENSDSYRIVFDVIPKEVPFRAEQKTPWPAISGMQTAVVTGPSGDEIYTDEYGRIKVQFHWDRLGKKDEKTTCFVRCVMPWTGKNWGMISVPRIGQEVAIQFEEGDPDRPICTGMLYNKDTMPPYKLPDNMTQTGIVTRSTKGGAADTFNELVFEDKKDAEFVRLQSEKDYTEIIKNNATITIGLEKADPGDLTQTIKNTKTETIEEGDHIFTVATGNQEISIKTDHTKTVEGKSTTTITGDTAMTVSDGAYSQEISTGDVTRDVSSGSETHTVASGDYTLDTTAGTIAISAGTEISLTVGANSIVIDSSGITISGTMVTVEGTATVDVASPATTVSADGILTLDGGTTMIN